MPATAVPSRSRQKCAVQSLPSMAHCGELLRPDEEKDEHVRQCKFCCDLESYQMGSNSQQDSQPPFQHPSVFLNTTTVDSPTWLAPSTPDWITESNSSSASSILDSRRSSVNFDSFLTDAAYPRNIPIRSCTLKKLDNGLESQGRKRGRHRDEMTEHQKIKADGKNRNEQEKRGDLGEQLQKFETQQRSIGVFHGAPQAAPNAKSSGLSVSKKHVLGNQFAIDQHTIDEALKQAIREDRVEELLESVANAVTLYWDREETGIRVTKGTLFDDGGATPCANIKGDLRCITHDHTDVRECRNEIAARVLKRNMAIYKAKGQRGLDDLPSAG